jgi:hypothetical protein
MPFVSFSKHQSKALVALSPELHKKCAGAGDRNRTRNLLFTKQLLCQLSYAGVL